MPEATDTRQTYWFTESALSATTQPRWPCRIAVRTDGNFGVAIEYCDIVRLQLVYSARQVSPL
eukprot:COSAG02_NODE_7022_length_3223_cov_2.989437_2_plen_63_part_00